MLNLQLTVIPLLKLSLMSLPWKTKHYPFFTFLSELHILSVSRIASSSYHPPASFGDPTAPQLHDAEAGFTPLSPYSMHFSGLRPHHVGTNFALN